MRILAFLLFLFAESCPPGARGPQGPRGFSAPIEPGGGGAQNSTFGNGIQVFGASSIAGPLTLSGNIKFDADATRDIGSKAVRANNIFAKSIHVNNTVDGGASIVSGAIQAASLTVHGTTTLNSDSAFPVTTDVNGNLHVAATLTVGGGLRLDESTSTWEQILTVNSGNGHLQLGTNAVDVPFALAVTGITTLDSMAAHHITTTGSGGLVVGDTLTVSSSAANPSGSSGNALMVPNGGVGISRSLFVGATLEVASSTVLDGGLIATDGAGNIEVQSLQFNTAPRFVGISAISVTLLSAQISAMTGVSTGATDVVLLSRITATYFTVLDARIEVFPGTILGGSSSYIDNQAYIATGSPSMQLFLVGGGSRVPMTPAADWPYSFWSADTGVTTNMRVTRQLTGTTYSSVDTVGADLVLGPSAVTVVTQPGSCSFQVTVTYISSAVA